ncbi:MAG: hypothetical protein SFY81_14685 [Verrucomicrobiota bacterium]|nr:hypothetical protein [Verrucomicrobiota bacterium]
MKTAQPVQGRISSDFKAVGTVTRSMVQQRAKEISLINGRMAEEFTASDWDQAMEELTGGSNPQVLAEEQESLSATTQPQEVPGNSGRKIPAVLPTDEQTLAEELVQEGANEAEHDRMLAGSTQETNQNS